MWNAFNVALRNIPAQSDDISAVTNAPWTLCQLNSRSAALNRTTTPARFYGDGVTALGRNVPQCDFKRPRFTFTQSQVQVLRLKNTKIRPGTVSGLVSMETERF
ncbi:hypothetical protein NL108_017216 [Boleophthalmus pectinirostris]|nr:hypothetical protein NL108_017216 [Boleophthalmus pectinirostris]